MKKSYEKPRLEVAEFCFSEHIASSGSGCYWGGTTQYTHGYFNCKEFYSESPGGWIDLNG